MERVKAAFQDTQDLHVIQHVVTIRMDQTAQWLVGIVPTSTGNNVITWLVYVHVSVVLVLKVNDVMKCQCCYHHHIIVRCRRQQILEQQYKEDKQDSEHDKKCKSTNEEYDNPLESGRYQELGVFNQMSLNDKLEWNIRYNRQMKRSVRHEEMTNINNTTVMFRPGIHTLRTTL